MAMSLGSGRGFRADINMTPMIDVLLVLIIIFMVITPTTSRGLETLVPQPSDRPPVASANDDIVVTVNADQTVEINQVPGTMAALHDRLREIFRANPSHVLFVRGSKDLVFQQVADVIDIARSAGLSRVALMTR